MKEVTSLGEGEAQGGRDGVEDLCRGLDITPLLKPRVPAEAHAGEGRKLLPPQSRGAALAAGLQPDIARHNALASGSQEGAEFDAL